MDQQDQRDTNGSTTITITTNADDKDKTDEVSRLVPGGKFPNQGKAILRSFLSLVLMLTIQVGIPLALYYGLRNTIGIVYALVISGIPPFLYVIFGFIRKRTIDVLGCIIGLSFILSGVVSIVSGDARAALIRDSAVSAVIGLMFLLSLIPIHTKWLDIRPLTYIMGLQMTTKLKFQWTDRDGNKQEQPVLEWQWEHIRYFRISMYTQSAIWGIVLILELMACVLMVEASDLSVDDIVMYNNILTSVVVGIMITASILAGMYGNKFIKRIGTAWTAENDFTEKFEQQQQDQINRDEERVANLV
ncbi:hypothetical protein BDB00DRAFT_771520 [Zychaea mexicana]|uniref:uncharacterized protein n=1 Tax=Zychaea mexicana TaxID=64656 RepID=UPI0022FE65E0|nr:uncharacterized protein BDB00DRAFT_771520 [Zychaea mexicana]KAI9488994.1 hypothetical protein BDB00DRAFT_771520 [Zychaea mexicana]